MPECIFSTLCWVYAQAFSSAELNIEVIFNSAELSRTECLSMSIPTHSTQDWLWKKDSPVCLRSSEKCSMIVARSKKMLKNIFDLLLWAPIDSRWLLVFQIQGKPDRASLPSNRWTVELFGMPCQIWQIRIRGNLEYWMDAPFETGTRAGGPCHAFVFWSTLKGLISSPSLSCGKLRILLAIFFRFLQHDLAENVHLTK